MALLRHSPQRYHPTPQRLSRVRLPWGRVTSLGCVLGAIGVVCLQTQASLGRSLAVADSTSLANPGTPDAVLLGEVPNYLRPSEACPTDYETLVTALLRDLPRYANLVVARSRGAIPDASPDQAPGSLAIPSVPVAGGTTLVASQPDINPLDVSDRAFSAGLDPTSDDLRQVFFTTLERQYLSDQVVSLQHFHWLFLTQAEDGWRAVLLYSSIGAYPADQRLTPPQESSQGVVGQAVRLWLRDCRSGAVFLTQSAPDPSTGE